jgi:hypothetical protein
MLVPKPSVSNKDKEALLSLTLCKEDKLRLSCLENKRLDEKGFEKGGAFSWGVFFQQEGRNSFGQQFFGSWVKREDRKKQTGLLTATPPSIMLYSREPPVVASVRVNCTGGRNVGAADVARHTFFIGAFSRGSKLACEKPKKLHKIPN